MNALAQENVNISRSDWDSFESSWNFKFHPLLLLPRDRYDAESTQFAKNRMDKLGLIAWHFEKWEEECQS